MCEECGRLRTKQETITDDRFLDALQHFCREETIALTALSVETYDGTKFGCVAFQGDEELGDKLYAIVEEWQIAKGIMEKKDN